MSESFSAFSRGVLSLGRADPIAWAVLRRVDSTNAVARRLARDQTGGLSVAVLAWEQSSGRGRHGRRWVSEAGQGIYLSVLLPKVRSVDLTLIPLRAGVAIADLLQLHVEPRISLKWPNDLLVDGQKLGGFLVEATSRGEVSSVIIGVGLNYGERPPEVEGCDTTSLGLLARKPPSRAALAVEAARALVGVGAEDCHGLETVERARTLAHHRDGDSMECRTAQGTMSGIYRGLDDRGLLRLEVEGSVRTVPDGQINEVGIVR